MCLSLKDHLASVRTVHCRRLSFPDRQNWRAPWPACRGFAPHIPQTSTAPQRTWSSDRTADAALQAAGRTLLLTCAFRNRCVGLQFQAMSQVQISWPLRFACGHDRCGFHCRLHCRLECLNGGCSRHGDRGRLWRCGYRSCGRCCNGHFGRGRCNGCFGRCGTRWRRRLHDDRGTLLHAQQVEVQGVEIHKGRTASDDQNTDEYPRFLYRCDAHVFPFPSKTHNSINIGPIDTN